MSFKNTLTSLQTLLPQHLLSQAMSYFTHCENPRLKNLLIQQIIQHYQVDMSQAAEENSATYRSFNHFFTRALKENARPITEMMNGIASPADGVVSQAGIIDGENLIQAKGKTFTVTDLLGGDNKWAETFQEGLFTTIYLSPRDYHRLHIPLSATLREMVHIPGRLFSVNQATTEAIPNLFARNERVVCFFETESAGMMALILVGAIFVSSIETVWHGVVTPPTSAQIRNWHYQDNPIRLEKGAEMGRFNMGSTIIVLFEKEKVQWLEDFVANKAIKMGELIGVH